jgi:hypothetical protein
MRTGIPRTIFTRRSTARPLRHANQCLPTPRAVDYPSTPRPQCEKCGSSTRARNQHPFPYPPSPRGSCFFPRALVGPRTLTTWESCMQVRASNHTAVCHKQGSTVHDLRHAHRVQSIPRKTMPSVSFDKNPSSAWHITSLLPAAHTRSPSSGDDQAIHPVETVISRITTPMHAITARASHSSLAP